MSTNDIYSRNQYLRVGSEWIKLFAPQEHGVYVVNTSGHTVKCLVSETVPSQPYPEEDAWAVGGNIGQFYVKPNQHLYARAVVDPDDDVVVACNTTGKPVSTDDLNDIRTQINYITSQMMRMNMTLTKYQLDQVKHINDFKIFANDYYMDMMLLHTREAARSSNIMDLNIRLFTAEIWIRKHAIEFATLAEKVKYFDSKSEVAKKVATMSEDLAEVLSTTTSLVSRLDYLEPKIEEGWQDYDKMVKEHITPMKEELTAFHTDMRYLNNALVRFTSAHTVEEVNGIFDEIIRDASDEVEDACISMRDLIVELMQSTTINAAQDIEIEDKIDYDDKVRMGMSLSDIVKLMHNKEDPEPEPDEDDEPVSTPEEAAARKLAASRRMSRASGKK